MNGSDLGSAAAAKDVATLIGLAAIAFAAGFLVTILAAVLQA